MPVNPGRLRLPHRVGGPNKITLAIVPPRPARVRSTAATLALVTVLGGVLGGCGVRLESEPPPIPTADAAEQARASAVEDALALGEAASTLTAGVEANSPTALVLAQIESGSTAHADALGGRWTPPPRPTPAETVGSPELTVASPADLVVALSEGFTQARDGATQASGEEATLLSSIALWRALAAWQLAGTIEGFDTAALPVGGVDDLALSLSTLTGVEDLIHGLDAAAFGYEAMAARTDVEGRAAAWNARAARLRGTGQVLAAASGIDGGANDPREAIYDVADLIALPAENAAASVETELATLWITAPLSGALRASAIDAALDSMRRAAELAPLAPLDSAAAVLPGLGGDTGRM